MDLSREEAEKIVREEHPDWELKREEEEGFDFEEGIITLTEVHYNKELDKHFRITYSRAPYSYQGDDWLLFDEWDFEVEEVKPYTRSIEVTEYIKVG